MADTLKGHWGGSIVTVATISELRDTGYLTPAIAARAPAAGQLVPAPNAGERVVFVPHLIRGLGFPLHPFVRGVMYYYGLDFHHMPPNSILHLTSFITVCETFLRCEPHFGLWLKLFGIKPKSSGSDLAECGGAMISKNQGATWFKGTFIETVKEWQKWWFYITEPLTPGQTEVPAFSAGPPKKLKSWKEKGVTWGNPKEVETLIDRILWWSTTGKVEVADVINVMFNRRILPLQLRATPMWAQKPEDLDSITTFFRSTLAAMWTKLMKLSKDKIPKEGKDRGLEDGYEAPPGK
jgi:hypothetical protein